MTRIDNPLGVASRRGLAALAAAGCLALLAHPPGAASAATIAVDTTADLHGTPGNCSLREAISSANDDAAVGGCAAGSGTDEIVVPGGTYRLTIARVLESAFDTDNSEGDLDATEPATIRPRFPLDRVVIDADGSTIDDRVLTVTADGAGLTVIGATLRGGASPVTGGGVYVLAGVLTLRRVTLTDNVSGANGGGIFSTNTGATVNLINSTIAGNHSDFSGGGFRVGGGIATIRNTTIVNNVADEDENGSGDGGGLSVSPMFTATVLSTLIASNDDQGGETPDCNVVAGGTLASAGSVLIGDPTGCGGYTPGPGDITGVDPRLGPLAFNGGSNKTRALRPGSRAINRGAGCEPTDQRGLPRSLGLGNRCDIGAYELARCAGAIVNRVGTSGPNRLVGTNGRDGIMGLAGNDRLFGRGGNDSLCGQNGNDRLFGQRGFDRLFGQRGFDRLLGGAKADRLFGGPGRDLLNGQRGRDRCAGGPGRDRVRRCAFTFR